MTIELEPLERLSKDIRDAGKLLSHEEARFLVDSYYQLQKIRIGTGNQKRALLKSGEPNLVIGWLTGTTERLEKQVTRVREPRNQGEPRRIREPDTL